MKNKIVKDGLFYALIFFLFILLFWPLNKVLNIISGSILLVFSIIYIVIYFKKFKLDKIDFILLGVPLLYSIILLCNRYISSVSNNLYAIFMLYVVCISIIVFRRALTKKKFNKFIDLFIVLSTVMLFVSLFAYVFGIQFNLIGITARFGDTYTNSIDRMYGTIGYCNATALIFTISIALIFNRLFQNKDSLIYKILLYLNICGFTITFSKSILIYMILLFIVTVIYLLLMKDKEKVKLIINNLIGVIVPVMLFVVSYRNLLISNNLFIFIFMIVIYSIIYIVILKIISLNKIINVIIICVLLLLIGYFYVKPLGMPFKIKDVLGEREYIVLDFILEDNSEYIVKINDNDDKTVMYELYKSIVIEEYYHDIMVSKGTTNKSEFKIKTGDDHEYYYLKVTNLNKDTDLVIENVVVNDKTYYLDFFLLPYHILHQKDLTEFDVQSVSSRFDYYKDSFRMLKKDGFIIGHGIDSFGTLKPNYEFKNDYLEVDPHSYLFQLWLDIGIYGVFYILFICLCGIYLMWKNKLNKNGVWVYFIFSILSMSLFFDCIFSSYFFQFLWLFVFLILLNIKKYCK